MKYLNAIHYIKKKEKKTLDQVYCELKKKNYEEGHQLH